MKTRIEVFTNSEGSGDWVVVKVNDETVFADHQISPADLVNILSDLGAHCSLIPCTDFEMEHLE